MEYSLLEQNENLKRNSQIKIFIYWILVPITLAFINLFNLAYVNIISFVYFVFFVISFGMLMMREYNSFLVFTGLQIYKTPLLLTLEEVVAKALMGDFSDLQKRRYQTNPETYTQVLKNIIISNDYTHHFKIFHILFSQGVKVDYDLLYMAFHRNFLPVGLLSLILREAASCLVNAQEYYKIALRRNLPKIVEIIHGKTGMQIPDLGEFGELSYEMTITLRKLKLVI